MRKWSIIVACLIAVSAQLCLAENPETNINAQQARQKSGQLAFQGPADSQQLSELTKTMQQSQFRQASQLQAQVMFREMFEHGLPVEPLINKVYEGIAKKISEEAILQALERVMTRYRFSYSLAHQLTGNNSRISEYGSLIANTLSAGLTKEECIGIMEQLRSRIRLMTQNEAHEMIVATLTTAKYMARRGSDAKTASNLILAALQQNAGEKEIRQLRYRHEYQNRFHHTGASNAQLTPGDESGQDFAVAERTPANGSGGARGAGSDTTDSSSPATGNSKNSRDTASAADSQAGSTRSKSDSGKESRGQGGGRRK